MKLTLICLIFCLSGYLPGAKAQDFHLCAPFVDKAVLGAPSARRWPVFVQLIGTGTKALGRVSHEQLHSVLTLRVGGDVFTRSVVQTRIRSGTVRGQFLTRQQAEAWRTRINHQLPSEPCGED